MRKNEGDFMDVKCCNAMRQWNIQLLEDPMKCFYTFSILINWERENQWFFFQYHWLFHPTLVSYGKSDTLKIILNQVSDERSAKLAVKYLWKWIDEEVNKYICKFLTEACSALLLLCIVNCVKLMNKQRWNIWKLT